MNRCAMQNPKFGIKVKDSLFLKSLNINLHTRYPSPLTAFEESLDTIKFFTGRRLNKSKKE